MGPPGVWWGLALGLGVVAWLLLLRMRTRFGRELRRVLIDDADRSDSPTTEAEALDTRGTPVEVGEPGARDE
jgi:hypothetical protein